jgi:hypothetical protein
MTTSCICLFSKFWLLFGLIFLINYGDMWFQIGGGFAYAFVYILFISSGGVRGGVRGGGGH